MEKSRGVVARRNGDQVTVETVHVPNPGPGEALIKVQACREDAPLLGVPVSRDAAHRAEGLTQGVA